MDNKTENPETATADQVKYDTIVLVHKNPDPDCIGAAVAVAVAYGAAIVVEKPLNDTLAWIPAQADVTVLVYDGKPIKDKRIAIVDCRDCGRIGFPVDWVDNEVFLVVDHHEGNSMAQEIPWAKEVVVSPSATATCEILTQVFLHTKEQAIALTAGMISDSKNMTVGVTESFLDALKKCVEKGASVETIQNKLQGKQFLDKEIAVLEAKAKMINFPKWEVVNGFWVVYGVLETPFPNSVQYLATFYKEVADIIIRLEKRGEGRFAGALYSEKINAGKACELLGGGGHQRNGGFEVAASNFDEAISIVTDLLKGGL